MKNKLVAEIFYDIAKILEIKGDNPFRIRAYERAAQNIEGLAQNIEEFISKDNLTAIPGIGKDLAQKIKEIVKTDKLKDYEKLKKSIPDGLLDMLSIPGIGPKTAKMLFNKLKIKDTQTLEKYALEGKLHSLPGVKKKTEENILRGIGLVKKAKGRMLLSNATDSASEIVEGLNKLPEAIKISPAGSLRRMKETVRDIDILVTATQPQKIIAAFTKLPQVKDVLAKGPTKASIVTKNAVQVDLRVMSEKSFGAALLYFTGSKAHNIHLRQLALKKGLKINEYGVFRKDKFIAGMTEEEIYKLLGMDYILPELREDTGEIEAALKGKLPNLIKLSDIRGDFHAHSTYSDGRYSIKQMAQAAKDLGYEYIALTDHSQSLKVAGGLSLVDLKKKFKEIQNLNRGFKNFKVLYGTEVDIDSDGRLDYKDETLAEFDVVVAAIHTGFKQSKQQLTRRIVNACKSKFVDIIAHPTGRLLSARDAYDIDLEEVIRAAKDTNTFLEVNAFPNRLDLNDINARLAKERGALLAIGTDSHTTGQLGFMKFGISVCSRGWLEKKDVLNTYSLKDVLKRMKQ